MQDAFSAGVEPGGLYSAQEIKILICYLLLSIEEPLQRQMVVNVLVGNGMANFFEVSAAIDDLVKQQHIREDADEVLQLTQTGQQVGQTLSTRIPYTLRERSVQAALRLLARMRRERENTVAIEKQAHGYRVTCSTLDGDEPLMSISLRVADDMQARLLRENFLEDPTLLYRSVLAILTGEATPNPGSRQLIIDLK